MAKLNFKTVCITAPDSFFYGHFKKVKTAACAELGWPGLIRKSERRQRHCRLLWREFKKYLSKRSKTWKNIKMIDLEPAPDWFPRAFWLVFHYTMRVSILHDITPHTYCPSVKLLEVCMFSYAACKVPDFPNFLVNKHNVLTILQSFRILTDELSPFPCSQVVSNVLKVCAWAWESPNPGAPRVMMVWPPLMKWARLCKQW